MTDSDDTSRPDYPSDSLPPRWHTEEERWAAVELSIQSAIRRGAFDNLPGAGKPIEHLHESQDPNWWIRRKIVDENITGIAPEVFQIKKESADLEPRLDAMGDEKSVRAYLQDFNLRIKRARMQLNGGPPVTTPLRDVEAEVRGWRERREPQPPENAPEAPKAKNNRWFHRRGH
ncbi:DUF1992 domain-containing protein [Microbacterium lacticum]|uniref:DnaJ family domain-containing protein n=1 Tax=Microbacterium lacticum TaxID=33885 RepID=UPI0018B08F9A|nr:DUF1992 domain-containing protein [Microbacterium lacticum]